MSQKFSWRSRKPEKTGWYVWRSMSGAESEIVHVWQLGPTKGERAYGSIDSWPMAYGWVVPTQSTRSLFLVKRAHAPAAMVDEDIGGEYLYEGEEALDALNMAFVPKASAKEYLGGLEELTKEKVEPKPKPKAAKKKSPKATGEADGEEAGGTGSVPVKPPGSL